MPLVNSTYLPPIPFRNGHFSTIFASGFRRIANIEQRRTQLPTPDGDFLDLDWSNAPNKTTSLAIIIHGLEGDSTRPYMKGSVRAFNDHNIDAVCVNLRSCSGKPNKLYTSYHSGKSDDLKVVVDAIVAKNQYQNIYLNGFSLGANIILKYLGEQDFPGQVKAAIAVSAPCDLYGTMLELHKAKNWIYAYRFKKTLLEKLRQKQLLFPDRIDLNTIKGIKTLKDFDDVYTSKAHGFIDAVDYYKKSSSLQYLSDIKIPTLILNALNDSFLSPSCFPREIAKNHPYLFFESPTYGGHVGFFKYGKSYFNEQRTIAFIQGLQ